MGKFLDGTPIHNGNSYEIGLPITFKIGVGMVIKAWDEAIINMKVGSKRKVLATPDKAYGEKGSSFVPPMTVRILIK